MKYFQPSPLLEDPQQQSTHSPGNAASQQALQDAMGGLYDHYFACQDYQRRYPAPNAATLAFLFAHGAGSARQILDFGCGNGRYALALLQQTKACVTGYDISLAALGAFKGLLDSTRFGSRATLLTGELDVLDPAKKFDLVLLLFGVLSHVGGQTARVKVLQHLRSTMTPQGRLVLSVPLDGAEGRLSCCRRGSSGPPVVRRACRSSLAILNSRACWPASPIRFSTTSTRPEACVANCMTVASKSWQWKLRVCCLSGW